MCDSKINVASGALNRGPVMCREAEKYKFSGTPQLQTHLGLSWNTLRTILESKINWMLSFHMQQSLNKFNFIGIPLYVRKMGKIPVQCTLKIFI